MTTIMVCRLKDRLFIFLCLGLYLNVFVCARAFNRIQNRQMCAKRRLINGLDIHVVASTTDIWFPIQVRISHCRCHFYHFEWYRDVINDRRWRVNGRKRAHVISWLRFINQTSDGTLCVTRIDEEVLLKLSRQRQPIMLIRSQPASMSFPENSSHLPHLAQSTESKLNAINVEIIFLI